VVYAVYRQVNCGAGVDEEIVVSGKAAVLLRPEPNPFSGETRFRFVLARAEKVSLSIYDVGGSRVATIVEGEFGPGSHTAVWSGLGAEGEPLGSGIYFAEVRTASGRSVQRVVLSR
jgi:hypothetical protein